MGSTMVEKLQTNQDLIRRVGFDQIFRHVLAEDVPGLILRNTFLSASDFADF